MSPGAQIRREGILQAGTFAQKRVISLPVIKLSKHGELYRFCAWLLRILIMPIILCFMMVHLHTALGGRRGNSSRSLQPWVKSLLPWDWNLLGDFQP